MKVSFSTDVNGNVIEVSIAAYGDEANDVLTKLFPDLAPKQPSLVDQVMKEVGEDHKLQAIKFVREKTNMGLKEAKDWVEQNVPAYQKDWVKQPAPAAIPPVREVYEDFPFPDYHY